MGVSVSIYKRPWGIHLVGVELFTITRGVVIHFGIGFRRVIALQFTKAAPVETIPVAGPPAA